MNWIDHAACQGKPLPWFFDLRFVASGLAVCETCSVQDPCYSYAKRMNTVGVFGNYLFLDRAITADRQKRILRRYGLTLRK